MDHSPPLTLSQKEDRRRVAFILAQIEFMNTSVQGRFSLLDERTWSVRFPSELDDEEIERLSQLGKAEAPNTNDDRASPEESKIGLQYYHRTAMLLRSIESNLFSSSRPKYSKILSMMKSVDLLGEEVPPPFELDFSEGSDGLDRQLRKGNPFTNILRSQISCLVDFVNMRLHHPFLVLPKGDGDKRAWEANWKMHRSKCLVAASE
jgi:hypothetical protein